MVRPYAGSRAQRAEGRPTGMSPGPGAPPEGTRANTANIRVAECCEATGMESIRPVANVSERRGGCIDLMKITKVETD